MDFKRMKEIAQTFGKNRGQELMTQALVAGPGQLQMKGRVDALELDGAPPRHLVAWLLVEAIEGERNIAEKRPAVVRQARLNLIETILDAIDLTLLAHRPFGEEHSEMFKLLFSQPDLASEPVLAMLCRVLIAQARTVGEHPQGFLPKEWPASLPVKVRTLLCGVYAAAGATQSKCVSDDGAPWGFCAQMMCQALKDPESAVRCAALTGYMFLKPDASCCSPEILNCLIDDDAPDVRMTAAKLMSAPEAPRDRAIFCALMYSALADDDAGTKEAAAKALAKWPKRRAGTEEVNITQPTVREVLQSLTNAMS